MAAIASPMNYGMVSPGIYRSGFPSRHNVPFLQQLKLRTLVLLDDGKGGKGSEAHTREVREWIEASGINVVNCTMSENKEPFVVMDPASVSNALRVLLDPMQHPVLVHSLRGGQRAGVLIGCLRRIQRWSIAATFEEYRRYSGANSCLLDMQYIELFDPSVDYRLQVYSVGEEESDAEGPPPGVSAKKRGGAADGGGATDGGSGAADDGSGLSAAEESHRPSGGSSGGSRGRVAPMASLSEVLSLRADRAERAASSAQVAASASTGHLPTLPALARRDG